MNLPSVIQNMPKGQKRAGKLLIGFFSLALVFTLVSRGLDSFSVAVVTTQAPGYGSLARKITATGTVQPLSEVAVAVPEGFLVKRSAVEAGSQVEEGDVLALLDLDSIEAKLAEARRELERARLNAAKAGVKAEVSEADGEEKALLALERAEEDLEVLERVNEEKVARAYSALSRVRYERNRLYEDGYEQEQMDAYEKEIEGLEAAYEDVLQEAERSERAAWRVIEDAHRALEDVDLERENTSAKEAAETQSAGLENRLNAITVEEKQVLIQKLEALIAAEGRILATQSGVVTQKNIETGAVTGSGGAFLLGEREAGCVFRGDVPDEMGKRLNRGDSVDISLPGRRQPVTAPITAITPPGEKGGDYTLTVELAEVELDPGVTATLTTEKRSDREGIIVPLSALYSEGGSTTAGYVFTLREKNTTMGVQTVTEKIPVDVLDRNEKSALVEGPLSREDRIVVGSSRSLTAGDRVREEESS